MSLTDKMLIRSIAHSRVSLWRMRGRDDGKEGETGEVNVNKKSNLKCQRYMEIM